MSLIFTRPMSLFVRYGRLAVSLLGPSNASPVPARLGVPLLRPPTTMKGSQWIRACSGCQGSGVGAGQSPQETKWKGHPPFVCASGGGRGGGNNNKKDPPPPLPPKTNSKTGSKTKCLPPKKSKGTKNDPNKCHGKFEQKKKNRCRGIDSIRDFCASWLYINRNNGVLINPLYCTPTRLYGLDKDGRLRWGPLCATVPLHRLFMAHIHPPKASCGVYRLRVSEYRKTW